MQRYLDASRGRRRADDLRVATTEEVDRFFTDAHVTCDSLVHSQLRQAKEYMLAVRCLFSQLGQQPSARTLGESVLVERAAANDAHLRRQEFM